MVCNHTALINAQSTMHNAQLAIDASIISKSGTFGVEKPAYAGMLKHGIGGITNGELSEMAKHGLT